MEIMDLLTCQIEEAKTSKDMQQMHSKVKGHYENHLNNPYYSTREFFKFNVVMIKVEMKIL